MLTFDEAKRMLAKRETKKLARNTYLREDNGRMVIKFWDTDIIAIDSDGTCKLDSGGYRTYTTKDRLNRFSPAPVWQERGLWYIMEGLWPDVTRTPFADGIRVNAQGKVLAGAGSEDLPKAMRKVDRLVSKYIAEYAAHVVKNGVDEDIKGDCWGCLMQDTNDKACKEPMGYSHYLSHLEEKYYVPCLLMKAVRDMGYGNPGFVWGMIKADVEQGGGSYHIKHALRKFFRVRKQGIVEAMMNP